MKKFYIPPILIAYSVITMVALFFLQPNYNIIVFPYNLIGLPTAFVGFYWMGKTRRLFKKYKTTLKIEKSEHLITDGVFAKSRNPMYVGMFVLILGLSIFSSNVFALILPFFFILVISLHFIPTEEKLMLDAFGDEYLVYKNNVRKWL